MFVDYQRTPQDLSFRVFGIPCRVHPYFWLIALLFAFPRQANLPGDLVVAYVITGVACLFVSILVHELGHAFLIRWAGFRPEIVLHGTGGLAMYHPHRRVGTGMSVAISFAGPAAGFALFGIVRLVHGWLLAANVGRINPVVANVFYQLEWINLFWGLVNLLPVFPLDGGQITRTLLRDYFGTRGLRLSLVISIVAAAGAAVAFFYMSGRQFLSMPVILFGILCVESIQEYQGTSDRRMY